MSPEEATARGTLAGIEDAESVFIEGGAAALAKSTDWSGAAISAAAHTFRGIPDDLREHFYQAYEDAASVRAKELAVFAYE